MHRYRRLPIFAGADISESRTDPPILFINQIESVLDPDPYCSPLLLFAENIDFHAIAYILSLVLLFAVSALMSGSETAFFSLSKSDIESFRSSREASEQTTARLLDRPERLLATILIVNNFVNIGIVLIFEYLLRYYVVIENDLLRVIVSVALTTFLLLLVGEVLPKVYATGNYKSFSRAAAAPMSLAVNLTRIFSAPLMLLSRGLEKLLARHKPSTLSVDNLSQVLEMTDEGDLDEEGEKRILEGIVSFGKTEARAVMTPRTQVFAVADNCPFERLKHQIVQQGYSRIPVYHDDPDHITGILYIKDLLAHLDTPGYAWQRLQRTPLFVPENRKIDDILVDFQEKKNHMAIVVDEYGGTSGILTMDDILEEIVGDISDEFDEEDAPYTRKDDTHYLFEGNIPLRDFYRAVDFDDDIEQSFEQAKGESDSLAGFLLELNGAFPQKGQQINFLHYTFTVEAVDRKRIRKIALALPDEKTPKEGA